MIKTLLSMSMFSLIATFSTFAFQTIATHTMAPYDYGILAKWLTDLGYIGIFFSLGLDSSLLYYAKLGEKIEENLGRNIITYSSILLIALFLISIFPIDKSYYYTLSISIFLFSISNVFCAYFQYYERFKIYNILLAIKPIIILLIFLLIFFNNKLLTIYHSLWLYTVGIIISSTIIFLIYLYNSYIKFISFNIFSLKYYKYGIKSILNTLLSLLLYASSVYMLTYMSGYNNVAYFFVASSISKMVWVIPDSAGNILYPSFLKINSEEEDKKAISLMYTYAQIIFLINICCVISFAVLGNFFLSQLYEKSYAVAYLPTTILLFGNQGMVFYKLISRYLASKNNWKPLYISLVVAFISNSILNILLIPKHGILGSAIASCISFWICGFSISLYIKGSFCSFLNPKSLIMIMCNLFINNKAIFKNA